MSGPSVDTIQARIAEIEKSTKLDEATKTRILGLLRDALQDVLLAETWRAGTRKFNEATRTGAEETARIAARLQSTRPDTQPDIPPDAKIGDLEEALATAEAELTRATAALAAAESAPRRRAIRRLEVRRLLQEVRTRAGELERQRRRPATEVEPSLLQVAQRLRLEAAHLTALREIESHESELAAQQASADSVPLEHDLAARRAAGVKRIVRELKKRVSAAKRAEAEAGIRRARRETALAEPAMSELAATNEELAKRRRKLIVDTEASVKSLGQVRECLAGLKKDFARVQDKVKAVGRTNTIGQLLRTQRASLPSTHEYIRTTELRQDEIRDVQAQIFELEERRMRLADMEKATGEVLDSLTARTAAVDDETDLEFAVRELLADQKRYVDLLVKESFQYLNTLVALDTAEREAVAAIDDYRDFIDENVLWIRSAAPIWDISNWQLSSLPERLVWSGNWRKPIGALASDFLSWPLLWLATFPLLAALFHARRRALRFVRESGVKASASAMQDFVPTVQVALLSALVAFPAFALLVFLAWRMSAGVETSLFARALAAGLWTSALIYLPVELFRQICRPDGLAERHFGWPAAAVHRLHRAAFQLLVLALPPALVSLAFNARQDVRWQDSLGRACFMVALCLAACVMHRLLRKRSEVSRAFLAEHPDKWMYRGLLTGYLLGVVFPLLLALVTALGYYYTAWYLASRWLETLGLLLGLLVLDALLLRWLLVSRRRLAINRAAKLREAAQIAQAASEDAASEPNATPAPVDQEPDLGTINAQARRMVSVFMATAGAVGLWLIWIDVVPALGILREVPLWQTAVEVTHGTGTIDGTTQTTTIETYRMVTLADLAWAALIAALTLVAARNVPGLLQIAVLQHLPIDKGLRYAITTVCRYLFVGFGVLWVCNFVGLTWGKVQWILAAMSVGLGFGLQEIFANFASGMVILFERPIRLGDIITIGDATGKVTKIQMRATTIQDWDRKELVVPNKEFATGRLLNWTLTDTVNRLVIGVGVSYKSDPERVREILLAVASEHPKVLDDPKPIAIFREFGSSDLMFSLRVYLGGMKGRLDVIHELHVAIHRAMHEAGIEIAYPQLDLHVRDTPASFEKEPK